MHKATYLLLIVFVAVTVGACSPSLPAWTPTPLPPTAAPASPTADPIAQPNSEQPVTVISLAPPLDSRKAELSGLAWRGDDLILLPQYPDRVDNQVFALPKSDIVAFLRGDVDGPLAVRSVAFDDAGMAAQIERFQGYEAITFVGDQAYLTIEAAPKGRMLGYLVTGVLEPDGGALRLEPGRRARIPVQSTLHNIADEALFPWEDRIFTVYEANGAAVNPSPEVHIYDADLKALPRLPFPNVEYRITDATTPDAEGRFWVINSFFPGEDDKLKPGEDPLTARFGEGPTHEALNTVERLVELQVTPEGIALTDASPIQLQLLPAGLPRNWEGIARLEVEGFDGFLLVTDEFPFTILAFVPRIR